MADAFGEDLFNVFDEDAASNRPVPTVELEERDGLPISKSGGDDDSRR